MVQSDYIFKNRCRHFTFAFKIRSKLQYAFKESDIVDGAVDVSSKHQNVFVYVNVRY